MSKPFIDIKLTYRDFIVNFVAGGSHKRPWFPGCQAYSVNIIGVYMYRGSIREFRTDDGSFVGSTDSEKLYNTNYVLDYPTYETYHDDAVWLCIESNKPLNTEYLRIQGDYIVPADTGVYCVLGSFRAGNEVEAKALNYMVPRPYALRISGDAKVLLIKRGEWVNKPTHLNY